MGLDIHSCLHAQDSSGLAKMKAFTFMSSFIHGRAPGADPGGMDGVASHPPSLILYAE
jgi:hypothetical protein